MKKRSFKERFKSLFTEKPKSNFWFWAFVTVILFEYVSPFALFIIIVPLLLGLAAPESDLTPTFENLSERFAEIFVGAMEAVFRGGASIAQNSPILSKVLFFVLANLVYLFYAMAIGLMFNFARYGIYYAFFKKKKEVNEDEKEIKKI